MRPSRIEINLEVAQSIAKRSTCLKAHVGCVITVDNRIITTGYNGAAKGEEHCVGESCNTDGHCENAVHAEANAIAYAAKKGVALEGGICYCTHSPCPDCAKLMIQAGIKEIHYIRWFKRTDFGLLVRANILHKQHSFVDENDI